MLFHFTHQLPPFLQLCLKMSTNTDRLQRHHNSLISRKTLHQHFVCRHLPAKLPKNCRKIQTSSSPLLSVTVCAGKREQANQGTDIWPNFCAHSPTVFCRPRRGRCRPGELPTASAPHRLPKAGRGGRQQGVPIQSSKHCGRQPSPPASAAETADAFHPLGEYAVQNGGHCSLALTTTADISGPLSTPNT